MLWKCSTQYTSKFGKLSSGQWTRKGQFSSNPKERQCQRLFKLPHNCTHLTCSKIMLKILQARLQQYVNHELPDIQVGFTKGRATRGQITNSYWIIKKVLEKHLLLLYWLCQSLWLCRSQPTVENSSRDGNTRPPDLPLEKPMRVRKQQLELDMEQQNGSK